MNQSQDGGAFMWTRMAKSELLGLDGVDQGPVADWHAQHDGYSRLVPGAVHRRRVRLDRQVGTIRIEDVVVCDGEHDCRLAFHLGPDVRCRLDGCEARLEWEKDSVRHEAIMTLPSTLVWSAVEGQTEPPLGWYSPLFGEKTPIVTLLGVGVTGGSQSLMTEIEF
jgi:hypothetical protein